MRYILDDEGYVSLCSDREISCENKTCTAYEGDVPEGYETIEEWVLNANINAYKVLEGQLVYDADKDAELQAIYKKQSGPSIAQMRTNGYPAFVDLAAVTSWSTSGNIESGEFVCEPLNNRIKIPAGSAKYIEVFGHVAGSGYAVFNTNIANGSTTFWCRDLFQFGGNYYWGNSLSKMIYEIPDTSQDTYVTLTCSGYNSTFTLNNGFWEGETFIGVKKIG